MWTISNFPFSKVRTSSGSSNRFRIVSSIAIVLPGVTVAQSSPAVCQIPPSDPILPIRLGESDQRPSFDCKALRSSDAVLSNEDPRRYQRPAHPIAGWQGCETTRRCSTNCAATRIARVLCGSTDASSANPAGCLQGGGTESTSEPLPSGPTHEHLGIHLRCRRPQQGSRESIAALPQ